MLWIDNVLMELKNQKIEGLDRKWKAKEWKVVEGIVMLSDSLVVWEEPLTFSFYSKDILKVIEDMKEKIIFLQQQAMWSDIWLDQIEPENIDRTLSLILNVVDNN